MKGEESLPWPEKHRPKTLDLLVGNKETLRALRDWIELWTRGVPDKRGALLIGPPGVGKTAAVGALSNDMNMELVEFNASDKRNKDSIETLVWRAASQDTLDGRGRIVLLDEVDGLSGTGDRGGVSAILKILHDSVHPVIMTANNPDSPRLKEFLKECRVFRFESIPQDSMVDVLQRVLKENESSATSDTLYAIAEAASGDLRAAISDLETHVTGGGLSEAADVYRDVRRTKEETVSRFFMSLDSAIARETLSESELDYDSLLLWIEENMHFHLVQPEELNQGLDALSLADVALGRIMRSQNWKLLGYVYDFLAGGVATSRHSTPFRKVEYSPPKWPLLVWRGNQIRGKQSSILNALSTLAQVSQRRTRRTHLDTIYRIVRKDPRMLGRMASWLGVDRKAFK
ncbi:MAG: replication factor C large subunit [Candidatus Thorarchaeota archaeon]